MTLGRSNKPDHFLINSDMRVVFACFAKNILICLFYLVTVYQSIAFAAILLSYLGLFSCCLVMTFLIRHKP